jgi:hypothetical protein
MTSVQALALALALAVALTTIAGAWQHCSRTDLTARQVTPAAPPLPAPATHTHTHTHTFTHMQVRGELAALGAGLRRRKEAAVARQLLELLQELAQRVAKVGG